MVGFFDQETYFCIRTGAGCTEEAGATFITGTGADTAGVDELLPA